MCVCVGGVVFSSLAAVQILLSHCSEGWIFCFTFLMMHHGKCTWENFSQTVAVTWRDEEEENRV